MSSISILKDRKGRPDGLRGPVDGLFTGGKLSLRRFGKLKRGQKKVLPICWIDMVKDLGDCSKRPKHGNSLPKAFHSCVIVGECRGAWRLL